LVRFIELYSKKRNNTFSYAKDWCGFNIPGSVIDNLYKLGIDDYNEYDEIIENIHKQVGNKNYYLIGSGSNDKPTIRHEICHALFFLDKNYKQSTTEIVKLLLPSLYKKITKLLTTLGYTKQVFVDELQAYLSTDCNLFKDLKLTKKERINLLDVETTLKIHFKNYKLKNNIKY
jgi:hypothetical protein